MENAIVITLHPEEKVDNVLTFEDAFGEHSNLFGKGKLRRAKRKLKRKTRKAARITKRKNRRQARHQKKADRLAEAQADVDQGNQEVADAKNISTDAVTPDPAPDDSGSQDSAPAPDDSSSGSPTVDSGAGLQDAGTVSQGGGGGGIGDDGDPNQIDNEFSEMEEESDDMVSDDDSGADGYSDTIGNDEWGFDGKKNLHYDDFYSFAGEEGDPVKAKIHPKVFETAKKAEWNREMVSQMEGQLKKMHPDDPRHEMICDKIEDHKDRVVDLEDKMDYYAMDAETSSADGLKESNRRYSEIGGARREARKHRINSRISRGQAATMQGINATSIEQGVGANVSEGRIEVPGDPASFTGVNGIDLQTDFDAPHPIKVELTSNAIGEEITSGLSVLKGKINWVGVGIGVGVAIIVIALIHQNKKTAK